MRDADNSIKIEVSVERAAQESKERPNDHLAHGKHATALMLEKRHKEAVDALRRAIIVLVASKSHQDEESSFQFDLYYSTYLHTIANCLSELGDLDGAIENYVKAIPKHNSPSLVWNDYGVTLNENSRPKEALKAFREAVCLDVGYELHWKNLGLTYEKLGRLDEAERVNAILTGDPSDDERKRTIANLLLDGRERQKAKEILEGLLESNQNDIGILMDLARAHNPYDSERGGEILDNILELNENEICALWERARHHCLNGEIEQGEKLLLRILEIEPDHENAKLTLRQIQNPDTSFRYTGPLAWNIHYHIAISILEKIEVYSNSILFFCTTIRELIHMGFPIRAYLIEAIEGPRDYTEIDDSLGAFIEPGELVFMLSTSRGTGMRKPDIGSFRLAGLDDVIFHGDTLSIMRAEDLMGVPRTPLSLMDKFYGLEIVDGESKRFPITMR